MFLGMIGHHSDTGRPGIAVEIGAILTGRERSYSQPLLNQFTDIKIDSDPASELAQIFQQQQGNLPVMHH